MKFTLNVQPLKDAMDLGIISSNISKFFEKSTVIQLTAQGDTLRINTQATSLISEACIKGSNEDGGYATAIVDCILFKSLVSTLTSNEMSLDFQDNSLVVESGKSKFNVPKLLTDEDAASLDRPASVDKLKDKFCTKLEPATWKYIQDHQLYAVAMSQIQKVYTRVWTSADKGVLTGDPQMSLFTFQEHSALDSDCLVSATVVNLLSALDEDSLLYHYNDSSYVAVMNCDAFTFTSQFTVEHEDETGIGTYAADMIFDMVLDDTQQPVKVSKSKLCANIKQASLFASSSNPLISVEADENGVKLVNKNVNCRISKDNAGISYSASFAVSDIDTVVSHMDEDSILIAPVVKDGEVFGLRFSTSNMVALLGGMEE